MNTALLSNQAGPPSGSKWFQKMIFLLLGDNLLFLLWYERNCVLFLALTHQQEDFADRTPGSFVELKRINVAWHYRNSDPEYGIFQARELMQELQAVACKFPIDIIHGKKCIEVKPRGVGKGDIFNPSP